MNPAKLVSAIMLVTLTLGAGLEINRAHLAAMLKNARLLSKVVFGNFIVVPIIGVLLARAFALDSDIATGFLLMAIAPGVPFVLVGARKKGGRLALAVTMALLFPLLSVVTVPITASLVLPPDREASLPVLQFVATLVLFQFVPVLVGMFIAYRFPESVAKLEKVIKLLFPLTILILLVFLGPRLIADIGAVYGSRGMLAIACIVVLSMLTGWLLGGPGEHERVTSSLGTALRNIGLCALVATSSFGTHSRIVSTVLVYLLIQFVLTMIAGAAFRRNIKSDAVIEEPAT
ncbi:MAG TPA: bile acid:sodium symporter [Candidatus Baltobacteraceae bacterium]|nr:bile acid:sodium symporter [Candidatus Baltobacteraceae bacterium]